jgi:hypothetical protein
VEQRLQAYHIRNTRPSTIIKRQRSCIGIDVSRRGCTSLLHGMLAYSNDSSSFKKLLCTRKYSALIAHNEPGVTFLTARTTSLCGRMSTPLRLCIRSMPQSTDIDRAN